MPALSAKLIQEGWKQKLSSPGPQRTSPSPSSHQAPPAISQVASLSQEQTITSEHISVCTLKIKLPLIKHHHSSGLTGPQEMNGFSGVAGTRSPLLLAGSEFQ